MIEENKPGNTIVGSLIAIDPDGPKTSSFSLIPGKTGCSATGFNWFTLSSGNEIRTLAPLDYETTSSYTLCVRATDSLGASFEKQISITVLDVNDSIFEDVNNTYWAWNYIERLYTSGITGGCNISPLMFCPGSIVTRDQMAVFLLKGKHGSSYVPPAATGIFADVPTNYWAAAWIEQLAVEGITSGCSVNPLQYCPGTAVTRDQMAVFLLKAKHGSGYIPPKATGIFVDVPTTYWAADWIEQLATEGITGGCGNNNYCPGMAVTRDQMAVFLVRNFNLP
jgi:hypothetical protein